jgi:RNase P/RNase MRP subunit p30
MYTDFVIPNNNEEDLINFAVKLNYKNLCFLYNIDDYEKKSKNKNIINIAKENNIKLYFGIICDEKKIQNAKKLSKITFCLPKENIRNTIEKLKPFSVFEIEDETINDSMHYKNSNLNHILSKIMHEKNITLSFSFSQILNSKNKAKLIGKIIQNIKLAQKYKVNTIIASFARNEFEMRNAKDLISFFNVLGMNQKKSKDSLCYFKKE